VELCGAEVPPAGAGVVAVPLFPVPVGEDVVGVDLVVVDGVVREPVVVEVEVPVRGACWRTDPPPKIVVWWLDVIACPAISSGSVSTAIAATQAARPVSTASFQRGRTR
jgi:hypothetical protein